MKNIIPIGIDNVTGQIGILESGVDGLISSGNDFTSSNYSGGDIDAGSTNDGGFVDVDAVNAQITFTVNNPGKYLVRFSFSCFSQGTISLAFSSRTSFRLTDGTDNSPALIGGCSMPLVATFTNSITNPFTLNRVFSFSSAGSVTVKLQKKNIVSTNINARNVLANSNSEIAMFAFRIAD